VITNWILTAMTAVFSFFSSLVPSLTVPSWLGSYGSLSSYATDVGNFLSPMYNWFPVSAFLTPLQAVLTLWPVIVGYMVFQWVWDHWITIFGWGPN
jgi:hypothetical protein